MEITDRVRKMYRYNHAWQGMEFANTGLWMWKMEEDI